MREPITPKPWWMTVDEALDVARVWSESGESHPLAGPLIVLAAEVIRLRETATP